MVFRSNIKNKKKRAPKAKDNGQGIKSKLRKASIFGSIAFVIFCAALLWEFRETPQKKETQRVARLAESRQALAQQLGESFQSQIYPEKVRLTLNGKFTESRIRYTFDKDLQIEAEKLLKQYKPDYGAIVVMDTISGKILAMKSFQNRGENIGNLALRASFPAASIFKIVTATAALDKYNVTPDTLIMFNGANHTLYKSNVMKDQINRWTREMTLREAFARSVNTVFAKIALKVLKPEDLQEYAIRFGFNKSIQSDLPIDVGFTNIPTEKNFHLTEIASGFNRVTSMSPVQGAMIAASVASKGEMKVPYIIDRVYDDKDEVIFQAEPVTAAVTMSPRGAENLKILMEDTIIRGTSRKSFQPMVKNRLFSDIELGGKTGSLHGTNPKGKTDWFVGYGIGEDSHIAVAAITVNVDYWTVKASYLAQRMFQKFFKEQFSDSNAKFFNASNNTENQ